MTHAADFLATALADHFAMFGESASYDPAGATAARTITVIVSEAKPEVEEEEYVERNKEVVRVEVLRNAVTGINLPAVGDTLVLRGETTAPYSFAVIESRTETWWILLYVRRRPQAVGPGATGRLGENA